ncbi:MAG: hypothetical protein DMF65_11135 [Acidobacteria bacterium]|nr:MAG: hypothetical protein DMF65_11135 [Acidobacteriota bacterium]
MAEKDPVKYFRGEIKRLNYYNSQFLKENDFNDEQLYHNQMRRFHNRALHTWGVVEGLEVTPVVGASKVTVAPGIAIDRLGQEIVLPEESDAIGLDNFGAGTKVYVTIKYADVKDPADKDTKATQTASEYYTRWTERPDVGASDTAPTADAPDVVLAVVTLGNDKAIAQVDRSVRRYAGSRIGSSDGGKEFGIYADTAGAWHFFDGGTGADRLTVDSKGTLKITSGDLQLDAGREIFFKDSGQIRSGDDNHRILFRRSDNKLELREWGDIVFSPGATAATETAKVLMSSSGNVGIGTPTPGFPLTFADAMGDKISLWGQSGNSYGFGVQSSLLQIHTDTAGTDIAFGYGSSGSFTETMRVKGNGNVGIGRNPGGAKLDVNGAVWTQALQITDGNGAVYTDNWIGMANNIDGATKWLHIGGITDSGERRLALIASRVHANGNLGIGTPSPVSQLHIKKDAATALGPVLTLMNAGGSTGAGAAIDFDGYDPIGQDPSARIQSLDDGKFSSHLAFLSKEPNANANKLKERVRISSAGNVGIGTNDPGTNRLRISRQIGSDDPSASQHDYQLEIRNGIGNRAFAIGLLDGGQAVLQVKEVNVGSGYKDLLLNPVSGNVGIGTTKSAVKLTVGGSGADIYATDVWVERNMHVQGNETLTQGGRGRLRVGTAWGYIGIYADPSSTGANDLVLGASSSNVRVGPSGGGQNLIVSGAITIGDWTVSSEGNSLFLRRGGSTVARFSTDWDRLLVFKDLNGVKPYFYFNQDGNFGLYKG